MEMHGRNLRTIRERSGMTQTDLAEAADVDRSHLSLIESGRRNASPPTAKRLADALGVDITDITVSDEPAEVTA